MKIRGRLIVRDQGPFQDPRAYLFDVLMIPEDAEIPWGYVEIDVVKEPEVMALDEEALGE